jgi:hypothetical protein
MKRSGVVIAVALLVLVIPAIAQTADLQATVPFAFSVGTQAMPAGNYLLSIDGWGQMWIRPAGVGEAVTAPTNGVGGGFTQDRPPKLVFNRYGNHYFLSEVWTGGTYRGHRLMISSTEREYARAMKAEPTTVAVGLKKQSPVKGPVSKEIPR